MQPHTHRIPNKHANTVPTGDIARLDGWIAVLCMVIWCVLVLRELLATHTTGPCSASVPSSTTSDDITFPFMVMLGVTDPGSSAAPMSFHVTMATGCASTQHTHLNVPPVSEHEESGNIMDRTVAEGEIWSPLGCSLESISP